MQTEIIKIQTIAQRRYIFKFLTAMKSRSSGLWRRVLMWLKVQCVGL